MIQNSRNGFTLIELLITVALTAVVAVTGFLVLGGFNSGRNLKSEGEQLVAALQNARQNSLSQQNGARWGVHLSNTTSTQGYVVFSGLSYASGTVASTHTLRGSIQFGNPFASSTIDVIFNPITGYLPSPQVLTLNDGRRDGLIYDIAIGALGKMSSIYDTGLVGYWHFNEGTSTIAYDASGRGNNGTLVNSPVWQSGSNCKAGNCLGLNGTSNYVSAGSSTITGTSPLTILGWLKVSSLSDYGLAVFVGDGTPGQSAWIGWTATAQVGTSNSIGGGFYGRNYGSGITDSNWHQVALTSSGGSSGTANLYVDGIPKTTDTYTPNLNSASVIFGKSNTTPAYWYAGSIDEVRVYNRALSAQEILDQYNALQ